MSNFSFSSFARRIALLAGPAGGVCLAVAVVVLWGLSGPLFGFSDTWQLVINTTTTIVTFLMVFIIQNTQNRDTEAMQIKLDELIRATQGAHNALLDLEELDEAQLDRYRRRYEALAAAARDKLGAGELDTDSPEIKELEAAVEHRLPQLAAPRPLPPAPGCPARAHTARRSAAARAAGGGIRGRRCGSARRALRAIRPWSAAIFEQRDVAQVAGQGPRSG